MKKAMRIAHTSNANASVAESMLQCNIERREDWNKELNHDDPFSPFAFEL